jgi:mannose-6-phosphate isomerase-like protein (cupin superfamily)
VSYVYQPKS